MEPVVAVGAAIVVLATIWALKVRRSADQTEGAIPREREKTQREVTQIELGGSIMEAQIIEQRLKAQGYTVSLLKHEHPETGSFRALGSAHSSCCAMRRRPCETRSTPEWNGPSRCSEVTARWWTSDQPATPSCWPARPGSYAVIPEAVQQEDRAPCLRSE